MKNNLVKHILTAAVSLSFGATAATVDSPWCTINSPDQVAADDVIEVEISLKNDAPAGLKLGGDLHFSNDKGAYLGFAAWGGNPKPLEPGKKNHVPLPYSQIERGSRRGVCAILSDARNLEGEGQGTPQCSHPACRNRAPIGSGNGDGCSGAGRPAKGGFLVHH